MSGKFGEKEDASMPTQPLVANPPGPPGPNSVLVPSQPAYYAVPWYDSMKFKSYVSAEVLLIIGWLIENLTQHAAHFHDWTWIAVTVSTLTLLGAVVKDWASPAVIAPFSALNQNNLPPSP